MPCGEKPGSYPLLNGAVRSLQSGLPANYREKWASFAYFGGKNAGISLQLGLAGGEGGIRTPGTLSGTPVFKTGAINHSATSPRHTILHRRCEQ